MRRKLTTVRAKSGAHNGNGNGNPRALIDESIYREFRNFINGDIPPHWDTQYSGWSNATRSRDYAIFLRPVAQAPDVGVDKPAPVTDLAIK